MYGITEQERKIIEDQMPDVGIAVLEDKGSCGRALNIKARIAGEGS